MQASPVYRCKLMMDEVSSVGCEAVRRTRADQVRASSLQRAGWLTPSSICDTKDFQSA